MNKITTGTKPNNIDKSNNTPNINITTNIQALKKPEQMDNKASLKIATDKASSTKLSKKPTLEESVKETLSNGLNYFKEIRKQAQADKAKGIKPIEGAKDLWAQLSAQADKIGQEARDKVLDDFIKSGSSVIADTFKANQITKAANGSTNSLTTNTSGLSSKATQTTGNATASKVIGGVGAAYSLYQLYNSFGKSSLAEGTLNGATVGAYAGSFFGPVGTVVGGALGAIIGAGLGSINNRKHPEAIQRDQMKDQLAEFGFLDKDSNIKLANGNSYSLSNSEKNNLINNDGTKRRGFQIDFSNPLTAKAIAYAQPLAEVLTAGHDKLKTDLIGYLVNAATSNTDNEEGVKKNILAFYNQSNLSQEALAENLVKLTEADRIKKEEIEVYGNDLSSLLSAPTEELSLVA